MNKIYLSILLAAGLASATVNYPYPQEKSYGNSTVNGVYAVTSDAGSSKLLTHFQSFLTNYYVESGNYARIKFTGTNENYTVSEGIGYAMLMSVYFSNSTTSYQSQFDKLWAYYQNWENSNGVMNWEINGFSSVVGSNGATDAEEDVALALCMAYYQFGDASYKTAAQTLIARIRQYEFDQSTYLHKPGDVWDTYKNPSYVAPAAYEVFKSFDNSTFWSNAITANYTLLKANQNSTTGLPSGWSDASGNPVGGNAGYVAYDYDAVRAPWRWATANAWFGHSDAKTLLAKLGAWVNTNKTAATALGPMYVTDGSAYGSAYANAPFVGSLMCALTYSSSYQTKLNSFYTNILSKNNENYFNDALRILTALLASGNMPNLAATTATSSSSSAVTSSSSVKSSSSVAVSSSSAKSSSSVASSSSVKSSSSVAVSSSSAKSSSSVKSSSSIAVSSSSISYSSAAVSSSSVIASSSATAAAGTEWTSAIAAISNITSTGVHIGSSTDWTSERVVTKLMGPIVSGTVYTLSYEATLQCGGANMDLETTLGNDVNKSTTLTACKTDTISYTFTATTSGTVTLTLTMPGSRWEAVDIFNLSLISASGENVTVPSSGNAAISTNAARATSAIQYTFANDALYVTLPAAMNARIDVFDMQGRHITTLLSGFAQGSVELSLRSLQSGLYIVRAMQGKNSTMFRIVKH